MADEQLDSESKGLDLTPPEGTEPDFGEAIGQAETPEQQEGVNLADLQAQYGQFDDATPEYVTKQPEKAEQPKLETDQPKERLTTDQAAGRVSQPKPNPANGPVKAVDSAAETAAKQTKKTAVQNAALRAEKDLAGGGGLNAAIDVASGALEGKNPNSLRAKAVRGVADLTKDIKDIAEVIETGGIMAIPAIWDILKRRWKVLLTLVLLIALPYNLFFLALALMLVGTGDPAALSGYGSGSVYALTDGTYCKEMNDVLPATKSSGKNIFLDAVVGKYGEEEAAHAPGKLNRNNASLSFYSTPRVDTGTTGFSDEELKYYITMRWAYIGHSWNNSGGKNLAGQLSPKDFAGQHLMLYNPTTKKAVVVIAAEYGPAAWTGAGYFSDGDGHPTTRRPAGDSLYVDPDQKALWGPDARLQAPLGFKGRVIGGPPTVTEALGGGVQDKNVVIGFVSNKTPLGPASCTEYKPAGSSIVGVSGQPLKVPGTNEGVSHSCGAASVISLIRYYNPSYRDSNMYDAGSNSTSTQSACVSTGYINSHAGDKIKDFVEANSTSREGAAPNPIASFDAVKRSVLAGDPVIMYTAKGAIYGNIQHIVCVVGWNESTQRFYIMNPKGKGAGFDLATETPNGKEMTIEHLQANIGDKPGGYFRSHGDHAFLIRSKYLKTSP